MDVFTANKRPLEELFGVDLIYLNKTRGALVMVQYKMLELERRARRRTMDELFGDDGEDEQEWTVRITTSSRTSFRACAGSTATSRRMVPTASIAVLSSSSSCAATPRRSPRDSYRIRPPRATDGWGRIEWPGRRSTD